MYRSSVSLPRSLARLTVVGAVLTCLLATGIGSAAAHVSVSSPDAVPGGFGKITFRVPNESDTASTVRIRIQLPTETPLASLRLQPLPGWTATTTRTQLDPPVKNDEGDTITDAVSVVEFAAAAGGGIGPGEFQEFSLAGGPFPKADSLVFKVVQSYSDGSEAAWIEPSVEGQAEPEHPAPVLTLGGNSAASAAGDVAGPSSAGHSHAAATSSSPGALALFVAILALLVAITGVVLGRRANRRTVSS
jgi:uncharacterized protein YcnI